MSRMVKVVVVWMVEEEEPVRLETVVPQQQQQMVEVRFEEKLECSGRTIGPHSREEHLEQDRPFVLEVAVVAAQGYHRKPLDLGSVDCTTNESNFLHNLHREGLFHLGTPLNLHTLKDPDK